MKTHFRKAVLALVLAMSLVAVPVMARAGDQPQYITDSKIEIDSGQVVSPADSELPAYVRGKITVTENGKETVTEIEKTELEKASDCPKITVELADDKSDHDVKVAWNLTLFREVEVQPEEDPDETTDNTDTEAGEEETSTIEDSSEAESAPDETTEDESETEDDLTDIEDSNVDTEPTVIEEVIRVCEGSTLYSYITEKSADVTLPDVTDIIEGQTLNVSFPNGVSGSAHVALVDAKGTEIISKDTDGDVSFIVPKLEDGMVYHFTATASFEYPEGSGLVWTYTVPDKSYTFRAAPGEPTVTVATSNTSDSYVKDGDTVILTVSGVKDGCTLSVKVNDEEISGEGGVYRYSVNALEDGSEIAWRVKVTDAYGNEPVRVTGGGITYLAPISASANVSADRAKIGDSVTLSWSANHSVAASGVFLEQEFSTGETSVAKTVLEMPDQSKTGYSVTLTDAAGNSFTLLGDPITVYAPLAASNVVFSPSEGYAKDGDLARLTFKINHACTYEGTVGGVVVTGTLTDAADLTTRIASLTDGSLVGYSIILTDDLGQTLVLSGDGATYLAPITLSADLSHTYSKTEGYVKDGDSLSASLSANHDVEVVSATFSGREASVNGKSIYMTVSGIPDGVITFRASVKDAAGNIAEIERNTFIICDNTAPAISVTPDINLFSSEDVRLVLTAEDANLDGASFILNGKDIAGYTGGETVTRIITISDEDEYTYSADATDKAGNTATASVGRVIVDKTNPSVTGYYLDLDDQVYAAGVTLSDFFGVTDKYLKSVDASVENVSGYVRAVGLDEPLADEGRQTARITATDQAGNTSKSVSYSYWIDGSAPSVTVSRTGTRQQLSDSDKNEVTEGDKLTITLDEIWMGDEDADKLTSVVFVDNTGTKSEQVTTERPLSELDVKVPKDSVELVVSAVDDVGNTLKGQTYPLTTLAKGSTGTTGGTIAPEQSATDTGRNGLLIGLGCAAGAGVLLLLVWLVVRKRRQAKEQ